MNAFCQISVASDHTGRLEKLKEKDFKKFKSSTTLFVFSDVIEKEVYEQILKKSWTVTPYEIIEYDDFDIKNYNTDAYSLATINSFLYSTTSMDMSKPSMPKLSANFDISMIDGKKISEELSKNKIKPSKKRKIIAANSSFIARFRLYFTTEYQQDRLGEAKYIANKEAFKEDAFYNYQPGFLLNYFQKINDLLLKEENYWMYQKYTTPELAKLKDEVLYIPANFKTFYNNYSYKKKEKRVQEAIEVFNNYNYKHEFIEMDLLNKRILANEEFYYIRYVGSGSEKFTEIVNAKTGEIIFKDYKGGFNFSLKMMKKNLKNLNKKIESTIN